MIWSSYINIIFITAPPPSYDSLFGRVRKAHKSNKGLIDFCTKILFILLGKCEYTFALHRRYAMQNSINFWFLFFSGLLSGYWIFFCDRNILDIHKFHPLGWLPNGKVHTYIRADSWRWHNDKVHSECLPKGSKVLQQWTGRWWDGGIHTNEIGSGWVIHAILSFNLDSFGYGSHPATNAFFKNLTFHWWIGSRWVYKIYQPSWNEADVNYCEKTLYLSAFCIVSSFYAFLALMTFFLIFVYYVGKALDWILTFTCNVKLITLFKKIVTRLQNCCRDLNYFLFIVYEMIMLITIPLYIIQNYTRM